MDTRPVFSRGSMVASLNELAVLLPMEGAAVGLALYGTACLVMATTLRVSATTIDAVAIEGQSAIDSAAGELAREHRWPSDWMSDRMRSHLNRRIEAPSHHMLLLRLPEAPLERLRVFIPEWDYMLSLEVSALPLDAPIDLQKRSELRYLLGVAGVRTAGDLDDLLTRYNSGPCEKRRMVALAHSVWRQCAAGESTGLAGRARPRPGGGP